MRELKKPIYVIDKDAPILRIRCPIHGFIHFSRNERRIIDHPLFHRLRYVRQLALTEYLYPGATHTRFEHSLGVMEVATRMFDTLKMKSGKVLANKFGEVRGMEGDSLAKARQILRLAALLHDIGHASFSHAAESVVHQGNGHEELTLKIVREKNFLGGLIQKIFWSRCAEFVAQVIDGNDLAPQLRILHDIVSGEVDADRTDYLMRDSHHCGVEYGRFDYRRLVECLEIIENELGGLEIGLNIDGMHTFEALILARYQINTQVMYHRIRRIYDLYLRKYHESLGDRCPKTAEEILENNDTTMMARIMEDARKNDKNETVHWAKRIFDRNHHKLVHDTGFNAMHADMQKSKKLLEHLKEKFPTVEFLEDSVEDVSIHKLILSTDKKQEGWRSLMLVNRYGEKIEIGEKSQILPRIDRVFQFSRIYADHHSPKQVEKVMNFAKNYFRSKEAG